MICCLRYCLLLLNWPKESDCHWHWLSSHWGCHFPLFVLRNNLQLNALSSLHWFMCFIMLCFTKAFKLTFNSIHTWKYVDLKLHQGLCALFTSNVFLLFSNSMFLPYQMPAAGGTYFPWTPKLFSLCLYTETHRTGSFVRAGVSPGQILQI